LVPRIEERMQAVGTGEQGAEEGKLCLREGRS